MENNFSIIISTCDKFSDLWDAHILLLNQNWADRNVETFLVTDKHTDRTFENVTVVAAGEGTYSSLHGCRIRFLPCFHR